jgi:poly(A) polymerase
VELRALAIGIVRRLREAGFSAFFVGGCVRDQLLERTPQDFDIATDARAEDIERLFLKTIPVGRQFGVLIVVEEGQQFQVATFRAESDYADGRHPGKVTFTDAINDARRRDFTVNGLFLDPLTGTVHDWVGGEADLRARLIRTIGAPEERFGEDHLRLLRAVRFAAQLGFEIEAGTFASVQARAADIRSVSAERVRDELLKLFRPPHAARGLELLRASGLLVEVLPEIAAMIGCEQPPEFHPEGDVFTHVKLMLEKMPADASESLPWTVLLHDVAKPVTQTRDADTGRIRFNEHERVGAEMAEAILRRLRFPNQQIEEIVACVRLHMQFKDAPQMRKATLRRMILRETFPVEMELHRLDCLGSHRKLDHYELLQREAVELANLPALVPPLLNGHDLLALGCPPGPPLGALLHELRDKQLAEELTTPDEARAWVKAHLLPKQ